jgi:hypothetical protein
MLVSHTHAFAFVHVPKTAGSSVHLALGRHATSADAYWANRWLGRLGIPVNRFAPWPYTKFRPHASAAVLQAWLPRDVFESLFKFAFVRNPWDLLVSYWHYLRSKPDHRRSGIARSLPSFAAYVEYEISRGRFSQTSMLCDRDGRLLVGAAVTVTAVSAGWVLSAAGQVIAFVPNELGKALLHNERITR